MLTTTRNMRRRAVVLLMLFLLVVCSLLAFRHIRQFWTSTLSASVAGRPPSSLQLQLLADDGYVRHCITGQVIGRVRDGERTRILGYPDDGWSVATAKQNSSERQRAFEEVFNNRMWGKGRETFSGLSASGGGSTVMYVQETIGTLHVVINELKRRLGVDRIRLLDMACGDMAWMSRFLVARDDVDFTGFDIVADIIAHHRQKYAVKQPTWKFEHRDFINDDSVDYGRFDLILLRLVLLNLKTASGQRALSRVSAAFTGGRTGYLLTTTFSKLDTNTEVLDEGGCRELNLEIPPLSLRPPACIINDGVQPNPRFLGLWSLPLTVAIGCDRVATINAGALGTLHSCTDWSL